MLHERARIGLSRTARRTPSDLIETFGTRRISWPGPSELSLVLSFNPPQKLSLQYRCGEAVASKLYGTAPRCRLGRRNYITHTTTKKM